MSSSSMEPAEVDDARLLARVWDWAGQAVGPIDAAQISRQASVIARAGTKREIGPRRAAWSRGLILGLAAMLLLTVVLAFAGATVLLHPPTAPTDAYRAIVTRFVDGGLDIVLADADGHERVLRRLTREGLGLDYRYVLEPYGGVSEQGWLEVPVSVGDTFARDGLERYGLNLVVDLADPSRQPIVVPGNGFMNGQFGPDGQWAHYSGGDSGGTVQVFDPDRGPDPLITVTGVQTFGGNPSFVWAADGSGFLARHGDVWGITPIDGGPFVPGIPKVMVRWLGPSPLGAEVPTDLSEPDVSRSAAALYDGELHWSMPVGTQFSSDGEAVWQLFDDPDGATPRALLAKVSGPEDVVSVHAYEVPLGPVLGFTLSPDDAFAAIHVGDYEQEVFVLTPTDPGRPVVSIGSIIDGHLAGLVPAAIADGWTGTDAIPMTKSPSASPR